MFYTQSLSVSLLRETVRNHSLDRSTTDTADAILLHSWGNDSAYKLVYYRQSLIDLFDDCRSIVFSQTIYIYIIVSGSLPIGDRVCRTVGWCSHL